MPKGISFNEDYKKTIVKLVENGKSVKDVASEYDVDRRLIYDWKKKYGTIVSSDGTITNNKEITALIKENKTLKDEVDILKKAMVIFTKK